MPHYIIIFFSAISVFIGILAGFLQILGYIVYFRHINKGLIKPNTASWSIWAFGALLESGSYIFSTGDWIKNVLPIVCALSAVTLFILCIYRGHFSPITNFEKMLVVLDCLAILIWWFYDSATYANLFLVVTAIISFLPIMLSVLRDPLREYAKPWYIWTVAYLLLTFVVLIRWQKWSDLVYPVVFVVLHFGVAIFATDRFRFKFF